MTVVCLMRTLFFYILCSRPTSKIYIGYLCIETENICFSKFPLKLPLLSLLVLVVLNVDSQVNVLGLEKVFK